MTIGQYKDIAAFKVNKVQSFNYRLAHGFILRFAFNLGLPHWVGSDAPAEIIFQQHHKSLLTILTDREENVQPEAINL